MNSPAVSVILPAYNCEKYIGAAIQSVLQQTLSDFELIVVNDGSVDKTNEVINSFRDKRIIYIKNSKNEGLIYSLNRAINLSQGKYIARMDADDICHRERLEKQKNYLDQHHEIAVIASTIEYINEHSEKTGEWALDKKTISGEQIKKMMLHQNCIAHPTVMIRSEILKKLKYKPYQKNIEDYDLWLRILSRNYKIAKINEPLLEYRIHSNSVTSTYLKKTNPFYKHLLMKTKYLTRFEHFSWFSLAVLGSAILDMVKGLGKGLKNIFQK